MDALLELSQPPALPGPDLRADEIDHLDSAILELLSQPDIETGRVNEDSQLGTPAFGVIEQCVETAIGPWQPRYHLRDADHGELVGIHNRLNARSPHEFAATAEEIDFGQPLTEGSSQPGAVDVTRALAGHHHQGLSH